MLLKNIIPLQERTSKAEEKENIPEASPKPATNQNFEQEHPVTVQMEELVEVVRIDREKCEFTTPVMITKIGPVKAQMEELVEVVRINTEKCEFTTPVMITKIEKGETVSGDVTDESTDDDQELGKNKNDKELDEPYILAKNESERNSMIRPPTRSENISETMTREEISLKNETAKEDSKKTIKVGTTNETARVVENIDFLGKIEKCACTATDQVPVLVLDKLKRIEKVEKVNEVKVEVKIFKVELDLDNSVSDREDTDKTDKSSLREKPLR